MDPEVRARLLFNVVLLTAPLLRVRWSRWSRWSGLLSGGRSDSSRLQEAMLLNKGGRRVSSRF